MKRDILMAKQLRADGIVLGILRRDGAVDLARTGELVELAQPVGVTFHRAFDMTLDLSKSLEDVVKAGATRILTSGGEASAENATDTIRGLVDAARGRIAIMACGGVREHNAKQIIEATGVREIHVGHGGVEVAVASQMQHRNEKLSMGSLPGREYGHFVVSEERVRSLVRALS